MSKLPKSHRVASASASRHTTPRPTHIDDNPTIIPTGMLLHLLIADQLLATWLLRAGQVILLRAETLILEQGGTEVGGGVDCL
jgi:hypothetical protein